MDLLGFARPRATPAVIRSEDAWKYELSEFAGVWGGVAAWVMILLVLLALGIWGAEHRPEIAMQFLALGGLYTLGVGMIGAFVGFLFGIPLVLAAAAPTAEGAQPSRPTSGRGLRTNTNLERISDWLTAGIVAISLANIGKVNELALAILDRADDAFTCPAAAPCGAAVIAPPAALALTLIGLLGGFVVGYVTTRVFLDHLFQGVEARGTLSGLTAERAQDLDRALQEDAQRAAQAPAALQAQATPATSLQALANDPLVQSLAQTPNETVREAKDPDAAKAVADARMATGDWRGALAMLEIASALLTLFGRGRDREKEASEISKRVELARPHVPPQG